MAKSILKAAPNTSIVLLSYIINNETGILVEDISGKKLAEGIQQFYSTRKSYDSQFIAKFAKDNFSKEQQALAYTKLYKQILN